MTLPFTDDDFFGKGVAFPFAFDTDTGGVQRRSGPESVEDALIMILGTYPGERFMNPSFGSRISAALFEMQTDEGEALLSAYVNEAISQDARLEALTGVKIRPDDIDPYKINVTVSYRLRRQSEDRNVVIPLSLG